MEKKKNSHYFTIRQRSFSITMLLSISDRKKIFLQLKIKILIKLINNTENFRNSGKLSLVPYTKGFGRITHF